MSWIAQGLGLLYTAVAVFTVFINVQAVLWNEELSRKVNALSLHQLVWLGMMMLTSILYGAAGLALMTMSALAVQLLGGGLALQAGFYTLISLGGDEDETSDKRWIKLIVGTAVFAFSTYAARQGVLT